MNLSVAGNAKRDAVADGVAKLRMVLPGLDVVRVQVSMLAACFAVVTVAFINCIAPVDVLDSSHCCASRGALPATGPVRVLLAAELRPRFSFQGGVSLEKAGEPSGIAGALGESSRDLRVVLSSPLPGASIGAKPVRSVRHLNRTIYALAAIHASLTHAAFGYELSPAGVTLLNEGARVAYGKTTRVDGHWLKYTTDGTRKYGKS